MALILSAVWFQLWLMRGMADALGYWSLTGLMGEALLVYLAAAAVLPRELRLLPYTWLQLPTPGPDVRAIRKKRAGRTPWAPPPGDNATGSQWRQLSAREARGRTAHVFTWTVTPSSLSKGSINVQASDYIGRFDRRDPYGLRQASTTRPAGPVRPGSRRRTRRRRRYRFADGSRPLKDQASLAFRLDGRMIERPVNVGDVLRAGQSWLSSTPDSAELAAHGPSTLVAEAQREKRASPSGDSGAFKGRLDVPGQV
jgi:hypothetical protein